MRSALFIKVCQISNTNPELASTFCFRTAGRCVFKLDTWVVVNFSFRHGFQKSEKICFLAEQTEFEYLYCLCEAVRMIEGT